MSFALSKIFWMMVHPVSLLLWLMLLGVYFRRRRPVLSTLLLGVVTLFLASLILSPIAYWVLTPLEQRFAANPKPAKVDGIIILGGAIRAGNSIRHQQPAVNESAERIIVGALLAKQYPQAKIVFSGGSGDLRHQSLREADAAGPLLISLGVEPSRLILERDSRNTWENALDSKALVHPAPGETWLLLTSAWHMPRSVGIFRKVGWPVVPYPVDYLGDFEGWTTLAPEESLYAVCLAEKEWLGLVSYYLMGRTSALFPAPEPAGADPRSQ
jgi:uncharacterized SAM-binding protein YcdF (DUF218 family)